MMKKLLLLMLLPLLFINCSSDDDDIPSNNHPIVGTWKYIEIKANVEGTNLTEEQKQLIIYSMDPAPASNGVIHITFNSDGTGWIKHFEDNTIDSFTYTITGNIINLKDDNENDNENETYTFEIQNNRLIITETNYNTLEYYQNLYPSAGITKTDLIITYEKI
ncbi:DUF5640 domain-containing protein [Apibacter raozihei]|uniref:lipocalin family protein n=1 Tax=Apibacter raozihei TaxID=2500547 RepID=UPI000FE3D7AA|nr:lipocalin family protein [Apibacter raozihei]